MKSGSFQFKNLGQIHKADLPGKKSSEVNHKAPSLLCPPAKGDCFLSKDPACLEEVEATHVSHSFD